MIKKIIVEKSEAGERLDVFLQQKIPDFSRNQIQDSIKTKRILVNNFPTKPAGKINTDDQIQIDIDYFDDLSKPIELIAEKIPLDVLFEDENILVIDKPAGMVVHPAHGNLSGTLVNAILDYEPNIADTVTTGTNYEKMRPGIVHRLDKDTSGVIIVAKNAKSLSSLSKQLANKTIKKTYLSLVFGETAKSGEIKSFLGRDKNDRKKIAVTDKDHGKLAITKFKKTQSRSYGDNKLSLLLIEIPTGRTHQIRTQMKSIGHPVIGDQTYFTKESKNISDIIGIKRQLLHASKIEFYHPKDNKIMVVESATSADFLAALNKLK
ncbi:MAG: RluA family pseudouridine synthase [Candidatus Berkelbacteria bacterium]|nr:RluA family pseudouridine synthase [Candidatus Berkelbacteria bacterium]